MHEQVKELEERLGIRFAKPELLRQAFTHSSYVNEHRMSANQDNERLEFLGDAVLELTVSEYLYNRYPDLPEGELTKMRAAIVCEPSLVAFAESLAFGSYVMLGKGEEMTGGRNRPALLADVFEAFIGALFLDKGLDAVRQFLHQYVFPHVSEEGNYKLIDYKTQLQELVQHGSKGTLHYEIVDEQGPAHGKQFFAEVSLDGRVLGSGQGKSKKEAEQQAAAQALQKLNAGMVWR